MTVTLAAERPTVAAPAPAQQQAGALAIRADQTVWTEQQEAALRQAGIGDDVAAAELSAFLHLCQRTGLDPFSRQIYLIGRYDKKKRRTVYTPQTGIDGYRVVARRATVASRGTYGYEDFLWCDESGRWRDVWLSSEPPAAAKVTVIRDGQRFSAVARFAEYAQTWDGSPSGMWGKMPSGQIAKCAEALALRKAFPHDLAGIYTAEEMAQADNAEQVPAMQRQQPQQADQWQQAAPARPADPGPAEVPPTGVTAAAEQWTTPTGRDYLREAHAAATEPAVRQIYADAKAEGAVPEYLAQIAKVGMTKPPAAPVSPAGQDDASGREAGATGYAEPVHGSMVPPEDVPLPGAPDDRKALGLATADMYAAGRAVGLAPGEVQQAFAERYGHGIATATVAEMARLTADMQQAAGGAQ